MLAQGTRLTQTQRDSLRLTMEDEITQLEGTRADLLEQLDAQTGWNLLPSTATQTQQTRREYKFFFSLGCFFLAKNKTSHFSLSF